MFKWFELAQRADVVCLQETHSLPQDVEQWKNEWDGDIYFSHGQGNARGVCIMIKPGLLHTIHTVVCDDMGRYIMLDLTLFDRRLTVMNIYAPNTDNPDFITDIAQILETLENDDRIIVGDFNCILDDNLDKKRGYTLPL